MSSTSHSRSSAPKHAQRRSNELTPTRFEDFIGVPDYTTRVIGGKEVALDADGFLVNPEDWTEEIAEELSREAGFARLTDLQWEIIWFLRKFYLANGRTPLNRDIKKQTGLNLLEIEAIFPAGIRHGARRLAGLPNPKSC